MNLHEANIFSMDVITFPQYSNRILKTIASDNIDDNTILYVMNNHGYRSEYFQNKGNFNILTLGCSWTMGVGVKQDECWPSVLLKELNIEDSKIFNYGMYGVSVSFIAKNFLKILQSKFIPDFCVIMWPGFSRRDYITNEGNFRKIGGFRIAHDKDPVWKNDKEDLLYLELQNDYQDFLTFWEAYNFVEVTSKLFKVPVFHTVAGYYYDMFTNNLSLAKKFVNDETFFYPTTCYNNDKMGRDKQHPSVKWHSNFATNLLTFIKNYNETKKIFTNIK